MKPSRLLRIGAVLATAAIAGTAAAETGIGTFARSGNAASPYEVAAAVGGVTYDVVCPPKQFHLDMSQEAATAEAMRGVNVYIERGGPAYRDYAILRALLNGAIDAALAQCPLTVSTIIEGNESTIGSVGFADIYVGAHGDTTTQVVHAREYERLYGSWDDVIDIGIDREQAEATAAAQRAAEAEAAQQAAAQAAANERAAREAARAQVAAAAAREAQQAAAAEAAARQAQIDAERAQRQKETIARWNRALGWIADLGLVALILAILFRNRTAIASWYYFHLHPHPAAPLVKAALGSGTVLDGEALITALNEKPPASSVFRAVRLQQAEELVAAMQNASAAHLCKQAAKSNATVQAECESAAYHGAHEAVMLAAAALERAKSLHRTSQEVKGQQ